MIIEHVDANKIKVVVDSEEQKRYGISYETMNYCDCNTRKLCENIVARAKNEVGFSVEDSKLLVEARQGLNGTVTLFLSRIPLNDKEKESLFGQTLKFESMNDLLDSAKVFLRYKESIKALNAYLYDKNYYVYFEILSTEKKAKSMLTNLLEYSERSGLSEDVLLEHGERIYTYL